VPTVPLVPDSSPADVNVTPAGSAPEVIAKVGAGHPVAVKLNVPGAPTAKLVEAALVMVGTWFTVSVKFCVALGAVPFDAVIVTG
jgi:hypothetical protein